MNIGLFNLQQLTPKKILLLGFSLALLLYPISRAFIRENEKSLFFELSERIEAKVAHMIRQADFGVLAVNSYFLSDEKLISESLLHNLRDQVYLDSHFPALLGMGIADKDFQAISLLSPHHPHLLADGDLRKVVKNLPDTKQKIAPEGSLIRRLTFLDNSKETASFIYLVPIFQKNNLAGWSFSIGNFNNLTTTLSSNIQGRLGVEIYDNLKMNRDNLVYSYQEPSQTSDADSSDFSRQKNIQLPGANWTLRVTALPRFHTLMNSVLPLIISFAIIILTILITSITERFSRIHSKIQKLVQEQTIELKEKTLALESALKVSTENEQRASSIIESIPGYVSWFDQDLKYLGVNQELARINELTPSDFIGKRLGSFESKDSTFISMLSLFSRTNEDRKILELNAFLGKVKKTLLVSLKKFGEDKKILVISIDISEIKQLQDELQLAKAQNANASRLSSLGEMAAGIAHEINNPLAIIMGRASILNRLIEQNPLDINHIRDSLRTIQKTTDRITKIIKGLRTFARDGDRDPTQIVSAHSVLTETMELCASRFKSNGIAVNVAPIDPRIRISCRPTQVMQILVNLLNNAHDAISSCEEKWIHVEVKSHGSFVSFFITDSGRGIPPTVQQKLMTPFFTTKEVGKGTGLGLSISRGIAEAHGGSLRYNPDSPNTQFILNIPSEADALNSVA